MQQESPHYLIIVFGPPACGKSTLARHILDIFQKDQTPFSSLLISTDSCEEYLGTHSIFQLKDLLAHPDGWQQLGQYKLKRANFNEDLWKKSRQFVREGVGQWVKERNLVIIEDDLLLNSQRKQMRQAVEGSEVLYVELLPTASLLQCQLNLAQRDSKLPQEEQLSIQTLRECYSKFQNDPNPYCYRVEKNDQISWTLLKSWLRPVVIEHPELKQKQTVSVDNAAKDLVEHQIRAFVSEIISNPLLRERYFKGRPLHEVASLTGKIKKAYPDKQKSLQSFVSFFEKETSKLI